MISHSSLVLVGSRLNLSNRIGARPEIWIATFGAAAGTAANLFATWTHGPGIGPDATSYIAAARALLEGRAPVMFDGSPFTWWPPGQPIMLALVSLLTGLDPLQASKFSGAFLSAVFIAISTVLVFRLSQRSLAITIFLTALNVAGLLSAPFRTADSEGLFFTACAAFLACADQMMARASRRALIGLGALAAVAALTRYVGISVVGVGGLLVLIFSEGDWRKRLIRTVVWGTFSCAPIALVMYWNWYLTGQPTGPRIPATLGVWEVLTRSAEGFTYWLLPKRFWPSAPHLLFFVAAYLGMAAALCFWRHPVFRRAFPPALLGVGFITFLILSALRIHLYDINARILAPAILPAILVAVVFAAPFLRKAPKLVRLTGAAAATLVCVIAMKSEIPRLQFLRANGEGFSSVAVMSSGTLRCLDERVPENALVFTNSPDILYLQRNRKSLFAPSKKGTPFFDYFGWGIEWWLDRISETDAPKYVLWFQSKYVLWFQSDDENMKRLGDMAELVEMPLIADCGDGVLYKIGSRKKVPEPSGTRQ